MAARVIYSVEIGPYLFEETVGAFPSYGDTPLWRFTIDGDTKAYREYYETLDHAMVAAVGQRYTGAQGASGSGVDTAAGWFMKMIGAHTD